MKFIKRIVQSFINKLAPNNHSFSNHPEKLFYNQWGYANTTKDLTADQKMKIFLHFQYSEKSKSRFICSIELSRWALFRIWIT